MSKDFELIEIDGGFIKTIVAELAEPNRKLVLEILSAPHQTEKGKIVRRYRLTFSEVKSLSFHIDADPWMEVLSHEAVNGTYCIICDEGSLRVEANAFNSSIVKEMPVVET